MRLETSLQNKSVDIFFAAIASIKNKQEARNFLRDLLTEAEIIEFANRWKVACMLADNISYVQIEKETGMSSTTIARIQKWLQNGMGGYVFMLRKLHHHPPFSHLREE